MSKVYVRLTEEELMKIQAALCENRKLGTENLIAKMDVLSSQMEPGTSLTLEAIAKETCRKIISH